MRLPVFFQQTTMRHLNTTSQPTQRANEARLGWVWLIDDEHIVYTAGSCPSSLFAGTTPKRPQPSQALEGKERAPS